MPESPNDVNNSGLKYQSKIIIWSNTKTPTTNWNDVFRDLRRMVNMPTSMLIEPPKNVATYNTFSGARRMRADAAILSRSTSVKVTKLVVNRSRGSVSRSKKYPIPKYNATHITIQSTSERDTSGFIMNVL